MTGSKQSLQHNNEKNSKYIRFCKDRASADSQIEQIPIASIQNKLGFQYMPDSLKDSVNLCKKLCGNLLAAYSVLENPEDTLVVHSISDRLGRSLTTIKPIKKNTIILEYVGEQIPTLQKKDNIYSIYIGYSPSYLKTFKNVKDGMVKLLEGAQGLVDLENGMFVSAKNKGNLSRFLNHLPDESRVKEVKCANLDVHYLPSPTGHLKAFCITTKDIGAFEELGFDYGENFFSESEEKPIYLNSKTGGIHEISQSTNNAASKVNNAIDKNPSQSEASTSLQVHLNNETGGVPEFNNAISKINNAIDNKSPQPNYEANTALQRNEKAGICNLKFTLVISAVILAMMLSYVMRDNAMNGQSR